MKRYVLMIFLLLNAAIYSELILDIDDTQLSKGETGVLSLEVKDQKIDNFQIEGIDNFKILSKGQRSSTTIINGKKSSSKTYQYVILPLKEGSFTLKVKGTYKKETYLSNELQIEVKKASNNNVRGNSNIFLQGKLNKTEFYFGEKIVLNEHLFSTINIDSLGFTNNPKYKNFTVKDLTKKNYEGKYTRINGKKAIDYTIYKAILEPMRSGEFVIPSRTLQVNTVDDSSFFSNVKSHYLETKEKKVKILELPEENKPKNFNDVVGVLKAESKYNKEKVNYGEAVNLNIKLRGNVNLDTLDKIIFDDIPDIKVYQNIKNTKEYIVDENYIVEKEYEIVFIPQKSGEVTIPEIEIPFFNTETRKYDSIKIKKHILNVKSTGKVISDKQEIVSKKPEVLINQISTETLEKKNNSKLLIIVISILSCTNIVSLGFIFLILKNKKINNSENISLKQAKIKIKKSKDAKELFDLLNEAIKIKYEVSIKSLSNEQLLKQLEEKDGNKVVNIVKEVETLKYFNKSIDKELIKKILENL